MSGHYSQFYIDKTNNPFSDTLLMGGLIRLCSDLHYFEYGVQGNSIISDQGSYYHVELESPITLEMIERHSGKLMPARLIQTTKNAANLPDDVVAYDYEQVKDDVSNFYAALRNKQDAQFPTYDWYTLQAINPAALPGYTSLLLNWRQVRGNADVLHLLFDLFQQTPNDVEQAKTIWKQIDQWGISAEATAQQLYNPDQGKGQNKTKSSGVSIGNISNFWLIEWLKAIGFYEFAITRQVRGGKDRKTFVIAPVQLDYAEHQAVFRAFVEEISSETSIRFDILAVLRYTKALLQYRFQEDVDMLGNYVPQKTVRGFYTAFYKDMGNAVATMNLSFIALPGWIRIQSKDELSIYLDKDDGLLDELIHMTRQFDESISDAYHLLQSLRDFVSGNDLAAFFQFTNAFPAYYMGMRERGKYAVNFTTTFIERLIMNTEEQLSDIIKSAGFKNIAYAIRQSTIIPQYRKKQGERKYDVRYGLGQELTRKSRYPAEFIAALSDFLHRYNAENAQIMETRPQPYRRSILTSDIDEIVALIDRFGSSTVANLLIAYGYARIPREDIPEEENNDEETE